MFCMNCGTKMPEKAKFCMNCGTPLMEMDQKQPESIQLTGTKLVPAKCTNCGAEVEVNASEKAAICPYCKSAYIVEQAINNFKVNMNGNMNIGTATINVMGAGTDNLIKRAEEFEELGDYEAALDYYDRVLDIDVSVVEARDGIARVKNKIADYVYFQTAATYLFTSGRLQLKRDVLIFLNNKGKETVYQLRDIHNPRKTMGCLGFVYEGKIAEISYSCTNVGEWVTLIQQAQQGIYPERRIGKKNSIEEYIVEHFNMKSKAQAIKYYREQTGASLADAVKKVQELL